MVDQSQIDRIHDDIHYQTIRFRMHNGMCEVSMMLLDMIDSMNKELNLLKKKVEKYEMDNE